MTQTSASVTLRERLSVRWTRTNLDQHVRQMVITASLHDRSFHITCLVPNVAGSMAEPWMSAFERIARQSNCPCFKAAIDSRLAFNIEHYGFFQILLPRSQFQQLVMGNLNVNDTLTGFCDSPDEQRVVGLEQVTTTFESPWRFFKFSCPDSTL